MKGHTLRKWQHQPGFELPTVCKAHVFPSTCTAETGQGRGNERGEDSGTSQSRNHPRHDSRTVGLLRASPEIKPPWEERAQKLDCTHAEAEMLVGLVHGAIQEMLRKMDECGPGGPEAETAGETAPGDGVEPRGGWVPGAVTPGVGRVRGPRSPSSSG